MTIAVPIQRVLRLQVHSGQDTLSLATSVSVHLQYGMRTTRQPARCRIGCTATALDSARAIGQRTSMPAIQLPRVAEVYALTVVRRSAAAKW